MVSDALSFEKIFSDANTNLGILFIVFLFAWRWWNSAPAVGETWILWQQTKAAKEASDITRLRDEVIRLDKRLHDEIDRADQDRAAQQQDRAAQQKENQRCRDELAAAVRRIAELEGYNIGRGSAAQDVTILESGKRLKDAGNEGGE